MREIRSKQIKDKVFRKKDLLNLSVVIIDEFQRAEKSAEDKKEKFYGTMSFSVKCDDDTTYQSETPDFWREGGIVDIKRIKSINMQLNCYLLNKLSIDVSLFRGGPAILNTITVDGLDQHQVNGVFNRLMDILSAVPPQKKSIRYFTNLMLLPASIGYAMFIWFFLAFLFTCFGIFVMPGETTSISRFLEVYVNLLGKRFEALWFTTIFGFQAALLTKLWVLDLWPEIEFDFGPDHMNIEKQRRNRILALCATVVVPILVTASYELTKAVFLK